MLRLKSLGQSVIESGEARVLPAADPLFATALFLVIAAGRRVSRGRLTRPLLTNLPDRPGKHRTPTEVVIVL